MAEDLGICIWKEGGKWVYNDKFIEWLKNNSRNYSGLHPLSKSIGVYAGTISKIIKSNNLKLEYNFRKEDPRFKAIYQDYDWCYQKYMVEGKNHKQMAEEAGCSMRVVEKWCSEIHRLTQKYRQKNTVLNATQKDLILGSILGDGHIDKREGQSIFIVSHAENQKDYLYWKYEILKNLCNKEPLYIPPRVMYIKGNPHDCQATYRVCTRIYDALDEYKFINRIDVINQLNEFSFSIHILDDSHRSPSSWELCVANFTEYEKDYFLNYIKEKFGVVESVCSYDNRYIRFNKENTEIIDKIILRNIPNDLDIIKYKILDKKNNKRKR